MCDFPAMKLLTLRRFIAQDLSGKLALPLVTKIDEMRWNHMEATGCQCWQKAMEAEPHPLSVLAKSGGE